MHISEGQNDPIQPEPPDGAAKSSIVSSTIGPDARALTRALEERFALHPPLGYVSGKTQIRNAVMGLVGVSEMEAETIVDTLHSRGFIQYRGDQTAVEPTRLDWVFTRDPAR